MEYSTVIWRVVRGWNGNRNIFPFEKIFPSKIYPYLKQGEYLVVRLDFPTNRKHRYTRKNDKEKMECGARTSSNLSISFLQFSQALLCENFYSMDLGKDRISNN
jgi:hypothetical protein